MNATIELIKAKQNAVKAEQNLAKAKQAEIFEARVRTFAPIKQLIEEAADLPAKEESNYSTISMRGNPTLVGSWIHRDPIISVEIMGRYGSNLCVSSHENGAFDIHYGHHCKDNRKNVTLEEAKNALIERLAILAK